MSINNEGAVLRKLNKDELMVNLAFKTLCSSREVQIESVYDEFEHGDLSSDDLDYLFDILVTSEKYTKEFLEVYASEKQTICILSKSKDAAKLYLNNEKMFGDVIDFDKETLTKVIEIFYNYGLTDEMTSFFIRLVEKLNNDELICYNSDFVDCLDDLIFVDGKIDDYVLGLKMLLEID